MRQASKVSGLLAAAVASFGLSAVASADSIGINFTGGFNASNPPVSLAQGDVAGVVSQANWNNEAGASGTGGGLLDNFGNATPASVTWSSPNTWASGTDTSTPNGKLLNGYIDSGGSAAKGAMVTVTNVPYPSYDVIVYLNTDAGSPRVGDYEVVTSGGTMTQQVVYTKSSNLTLAPPLLSNTTAISGTTPAGTYIVFPSLTDSTLNLKTDQASLPNVNFRAPISGIQIYGIPEPGTLGMLTVLGGAALARTRRRAAAE